jgi:hypothetical protein
MFSIACLAVLTAVAHFPITCRLRIQPRLVIAGGLGVLASTVALGGGHSHPYAPGPRALVCGSVRAGTGNQPADVRPVLRWTDATDVRNPLS